MKTLNRFALALSVVAALVVLLAPAAHAQNKTIANIPFDFTVQNVTLPAGEYALQATSATLSGLVQITNADTRKTVMVMAAPSLSSHKGKADGNGKLIFHRYGDRYFFAEVWSPNGPTGGVMPSKLERELQSSEGKQMASVIIPLSGAAQ